MEVTVVDLPEAAVRQAGSFIVTGYTAHALLYRDQVRMGQRMERRAEEGKRDGKIGEALRERIEFL